MCLIISIVFIYLAIEFFNSGDILNALINGAIAIIFIFLLIRNILKTKNEKKQIDKIKEE